MFLGMLMLKEIRQETPVRVRLNVTRWILGILPMTPHAYANSPAISKRFGI